MGAKMPFLTQKHKKGEQGGGLPPKDKNMAHPNLPHIPITPSLTPSSWYAQLFSPQPGSHTSCFQKHNTSPPQQERQTRDKNEGRKFFSLPKRVKPQICLDLLVLVRRRKRDTSAWFWKKTWVWNKNKDKIRKFGLERIKNCLKKKEQNQKQTVFAWTHFLFDNELKSLYFGLHFPYANTINGTNWLGTPLFATYTFLRYYTFSTP
jgi:hypothetical protein